MPPRRKMASAICINGLPVGLNRLTLSFPGCIGPNLSDAIGRAPHASRSSPRNRVRNPQMGVDGRTIAVPPRSETSGVAGGSAWPRLESWQCSQVVAVDSIGDGFEIFDPIRPDLDENRLSHVVVTIRIVGQRDDPVAGRTHDINHPEPCNLDGRANLPTRIPARDDPPILN